MSENKKRDLDNEEKEILEWQAKRNKRTEEMIRGNASSSYMDEKRRRMVMGKQKDQLILENERLKSRREYLSKRKDDQILDLELAQQEEKLYFKDAELTENEKRRNEFNKILLSTVKLQEKRDKEAERYYEMPTEQMNDKDYVEDRKKDKNKKKGISEWEARQLKSGYTDYQKKTKRMPGPDDEYEMLIDDFLDYDLIGRENEPENSTEIPEPQEVVKKESDCSIDEIRKSLPIYKFRKELLDTIRKNQVVVVEGETGSGKTTQMPQYLIEDGFCENNLMIGCTQPRRVAAMSVAARVSQEMSCKLGDRVGYSVRFEARISDATQIKYMTDGMLLREFLIDPQMKNYSVLIIDEAHERTLQTDVVFGLLKIVLDNRPELRVIVSSATCDTEKFSEYFDGAPVFKIPGRRYPVDIYYTKFQEPNYVEAAVVTIFQIHITQEEGDILVFLTGQEEIEEAMDDIQERIRALDTKIKELIVLPVYSALPSEKQVKIFLPTPPGARKVVLATNIAETSLTIDNIKYVIDSGYCKMKSYNAKSRLDTLKVCPISQASAIQRAGRAGRVGPGRCFRLYKKCTFDEELEKQPIPEIQRTSLGNVVLLLVSLGVNVKEIRDFPFLDQPDKRSVDQAIKELYFLGAITTKGTLSLRGNKMVELPCDPMVSAMIVRSPEFGCSEEILTIAAMLSSDDAGSVFYRPRHKKVYADQAHRNMLHEDGDYLSLLAVYKRYVLSDYSPDWCKENFIQARSMKTARNVRDQLTALCDRLELPLVSCGDNPLSVRKAITSGFFINTARFHGDCYRRLKTHEPVYLHPSSVFRVIDEAPPRYVVFANVVETDKEWMRTVLKIEPEWLPEIAPHVYKDADFKEDNTLRHKKKKKKKDYQKI